MECITKGQTFGQNSNGYYCASEKRGYRHIHLLHHWEVHLCIPKTLFLLALEQDVVQASKL